MTCERSFQRHLMLGSVITVILALFISSPGGVSLFADDEPAPPLVNPVDVPVLDAPPIATPPIPATSLTAPVAVPQPPRRVTPAPPRPTPLGPSDSEIHNLPYSRPPRPGTPIPVIPNPNLGALGLPQIAPHQPQPSLQAVQQPVAPSPAEPQAFIVSLLHVVIEHPAGEESDLASQVVDRLRDGSSLELPPESVRLAQRLSLTGVTDTRCYCQIGEEKAHITQSRIDERTGSQTNSFQMIPVGTILEVIARRMGDDAFTLECDYESSRLSLDEEGLVIAQSGEQSVRTSDVDQFRVNTTVAVKSGEPITLSGTRQILSDGRVLETIVGLVLTTVE